MSLCEHMYIIFFFFSERERGRCLDEIFRGYRCLYPDEVRMVQGEGIYGQVEG